MHGRDGQRVENGSQKTPGQCSIAAELSLQDPVDEIDHEEGVGCLHESHEQHLDPGIVDAKGPAGGHDRGNGAGQQRRSRVRGGQSGAGRDLIGRADHDVMIVAGEKSLTENRGEQAQRTAEQQHAPQVAIYVGFPGGSLPVLTIV